MAFTIETFINAPRERVFEFATDYNNAIAIMDTVVEVEKLTEGPLGQGTKLREVREIRGLKAESVVVVTEYHPTEKYVIRNEHKGYAVEYYYEFTPKDTGTSVTCKGIVRASGIKNWLLKPVFKQIIKKEDGNHLKQMKKLLENEGTEE